MTDTDVLVKWADAIEMAEGFRGLGARCIRDLAAEVRALRIKARDRDAAHLVWMNDAVGHAAKLQMEVDELRERLAAQEPDATLGRLVREGREAM